MLQQIRSSLEWAASGIFDRPRKPTKAELERAEHRKVKKMLRRAMYLLNRCEPPQKAHAGPCSPMATCCDGSCSDQYYWLQDCGKLEQEHKEWLATQQR